MTKFTTFISGYNTANLLPRVDMAALTPEQQWERTVQQDAFGREHFVQIKHAGVCKPETVRKLAARHGIVACLAAEAVSFDPSGKGRHVVRKIEL